MGIVGERLRAFREKNGLSQRDLAKKSGVSGPLISIYETGKNEPSLENLIALAEALRITINDLTGYPDAREPSAPPLTPEQKSILEAMDALTPEDRAMILQMAKRIKKGD